MNNGVKKRFIELGIIDIPPKKWVSFKDEDYTDVSVDYIHINHNFERYRHEYLGEFVKSRCDVYHYDTRTNKKKYCDNEVEYVFERNGEEIKLCERCYESYKNGAFDNNRYMRESGVRFRI